MDMMKTIQNVVKCESQNLLEAYNSLESETVKNVIRLIENCKGKIIVSGCGTSGMAARKIVHTLNVVNCPSIFISPADALHGGLGVMQPQDIVILISKGGATDELLPVEKVAHIKKLKIIVVTENKEAELAKKSDCVFFIKVAREPDKFNMMATGSTIAVMSIFDAISLFIAEKKGYTKQELAVIHPGGAVGKKLNGRGM